MTRSGPTGHAAPRAAARLALVVLGLAPLLATAAEPPALEQLFGRPAIEGDRPDPGKPSPDGRWVAFAWNDRGQRSPRDLWLVPADGSRPAFNLTRFADPTADAPGTVRAWRPKKGDEPRRLLVDAFDWSPRSDFLALAAGGDLWTVTRDGALTRLTDSEAAESSPQLSPDGRRLAFVSAGDLWTIALAPGNGPTLVQLTRHEEGESWEQPTWSPTGERIAAIRRDDRQRFDLVIPEYMKEKVEAGKVRGGWSDEAVGVVALGGGEPLLPELGELAPATVHAFRFSPDGGRLLVDGGSRDWKTRTLHLVDLGPDRSAVARLLDAERDERWTFTLDGTLARDMATAFSPDGRRVLFLSERSGFAQPWIIDLDETEACARAAGTGRFETTWAAWLTDRALVSLDNRSDAAERRPWRIDLGTGRTEELGPLAGLSAAPVLSRDRSLLLVSHSRLTSPSELVAVALPSGRATTVTRSVPRAFHRIPWVTPRIETISALDGTPLRVFLYDAAEVASPRTRPAVIFVHGAGYLQNVLDGWTIYAPNFKFATRLARKGYLVAEVDYRGSAGYGREFRTAVHGHLGGKDVDDIVALARWLRQSHGAGPIGIYGGSYGGFAALMALFQHPGDFNAGAALRFVSDWENYHRGNPYYCVQRLGTPEANPEAYRRSSPIHFAAGLRAPLLLLHGIRDSNVHVQDAMQLVARLVELGKPFEVMLYPREGHGFDSPEGWLDGYGRIERFFDSSLHDSVTSHDP